MNTWKGEVYIFLPEVDSDGKDSELGVAYGVLLSESLVIILADQFLRAQLHRKTSLKLKL